MRISTPFTITVTAFGLILSIASLGYGEDRGHPSGMDLSREPMALSIEEALRKAIENDIGIRIEQQNPQIRSSEITVEKGKFDPKFTTSLTDRVSLTPRPVSVIEGAFLTSEVENGQVEYSVGWEQRIITGADYRLRLSNTRSRGSLQSFNPSYQSTLSLDFTQPLLSGFGLSFNRSPISIAQNNLSLSQEAFSAKVMDLVKEVQNLYWDLFYQRENFKVRTQSLKAAQELLEINKAKVQEGILAPVEVLVAEAEVAGREEEVLLAEKGVKDSQDRLRRLIYPLDIDQPDDRAIIPTDEPVQKQQPAELTQAIQTALRYRPDIKQARINLKNKKISVMTARNQTLPSLNFEGSVGLNGLGDSHENDIDRLTSTDFYHWQAGLFFTLPIGNRTARGNLGKQKNEMGKAQLDIKNLEQGVIVEVKEAIRRLETDAKRIEATRKARFLSEKKVEVETERYNLGLATTHDLLEFQRDLANAQTNELKALLDYNRSLVHLDRVQGTSLNTYNITLRENP